MKDIEYYIKLGKTELGLTGGDLLLWATEREALEAKKADAVRADRLAEREHELKLKETELKLKENEIKLKQLKLKDTELELKNNEIKLKQLVLETARETKNKSGNRDSNPDSEKTSRENVFKPCFRGKYNHGGTPGRSEELFGRGGQNTNSNPNDQNFKCHNCGGVGHFKKNCTSPILSTGKQEYPNLKKENVDKNDPTITCYECIEKGLYCKNVKCFSCNKYGHYAKKCPEFKGKQVRYSCEFCLNQGHEYCHDRCYKLDIFIKRLDQGQVKYDKEICAYCNKGVHGILYCHEINRLSDENKDEWIRNWLKENF